MGEVEKPLINQKVHELSTGFSYCNKEKQTQFKIFLALCKKNWILLGPAG